MQRMMMTLALTASLGVAGSAIPVRAADTGAAETSRAARATATTMTTTATTVAGAATAPDAGAAPAAAAEADDVKAAELKRFKAMTTGEFDTLAALLADDLVYTHSDSKVDSKASYMATLQSRKTVYEVIEPADLQVRVFGSIAIIHGTAKMRVKAGENLLNNALRFIDVWEKRNGTWQMIAWQSTKMP